MDKRKAFTPLELEITKIEPSDVITCSVVEKDPNVDDGGWTKPSQSKYLNN